MSNMSDSAQKFGWTAVPRDPARSIAFDSVKAKPLPDAGDEDHWPTSALVRKTREWARGELDAETFNHSMRVYHFGRTILTQHLPSWESSSVLETWALTCLLHDIGTTDKNRSATFMSFEFYGGQLALSKLVEFGAPEPQAELVCEAIIRHQDAGSTGTIPRIGWLIQQATLFDNCGVFPSLVHMDTVESTTKAWPRLGWCGCFAGKVRQEIRAKPWCHTTVIEEDGKEFAELIEANELMRPYE